MAPNMLRYPICPNLLVLKTKNGDKIFVDLDEGKY